MIPTLAVGCFTLVLAVGGGVLWRRLLPRAVCPSCGEATQGVVLARPLRVLQRLVRRRWCPACRWTGLGRNGPVLWARNGRVAHDSGFRWNARDLASNMGFCWASEADAGPAEGAAGPAPGFRWGGEEPEDAPPHTSGFRWGDEPGGADTDAARSHPPEFRWARAHAPAPRIDGDPSSAVAEEPEGRARRFLPLSDAERAVGFRWAGFRGGRQPARGS